MATKRLSVLAQHLTGSDSGDGDGGHPRKPLTLLHSGDLHLINEANPPEDEIERKLAILLELARDRGVDVLLLAGDLFDGNHNLPHHVEILMHVLGEFPIPVVIMSGNHDGELMRDLPRGLLPSNVQLLESEDGQSCEIKIGEGSGLVVWAKSTYQHNAEFQPLAGIPPRPAGNNWYVVMGHGLFTESKFVSEGRSSLITAEQVTKIHRKKVRCCLFLYIYTISVTFVCAVCRFRTPMLITLRSDMFTLSVIAAKVGCQLSIRARRGMRLNQQQL